MNIQTLACIVWKSSHNDISCCVHIVTRIKNDMGVAIRIPPDTEKSNIIRIEGNPEGVALAKKELLDMVAKMVCLIIIKLYYIEFVIDNYNKGVTICASDYEYLFNSHLLFDVKQVLSCKRPSYLHSLFTLVRNHFQLWSFSSDILFVPKVNIGTRSFAVGAPTLWNMLPSSVKSVENIAKFCCHLKTYLCNLAYSP